MRPLWKDILAAAWLGILIPGIVLNAAVLFTRQPTQEVAAETRPEPSETVLLTLDTGDTTLSMEEYLTGVVLAEMPASFHPEALKAQTVAAGTYARKSAKHEGSLCGNPDCCQAYISPEDYILKGGTPEDAEKVRQAVMAVTPYVLMYEDELIEAVYFSSSGGKTESALAVWGADFPYLQSVESPAEEAVNYQNRLHTFSISDFQNHLNIQLTGPQEKWFSDVTYTEGGGVESIIIGETEFSGVQIRHLLNLPSTAFSITASENEVFILTNGYGHRVGLSQYGANSMAKQGYTFQEILSHFYPETKLVSME